MALDQHDDTQREHQKDSPEDWGWHGDFSRAALVGGWLTAIVLMLMATSTHYNGQGTLFLGLSAGAIVVMAVMFQRSRKNSWRK